MITKEYKISLFRIICRDSARDPDIKLTVGKSYIAVTENMKMFSVYEDNMITLIGTFDLGALCAYFSFLEEDAHIIGNYLSYDNYIQNTTENNLYYFEEI